ncbi:uncharacterized protein LOC106166864 [Lingula anatina]|uniref:Uncharacterized protein LOC106166864 n=1 Tax=Lingula anatina TaxID=7574 RepID=A0A1S3ISD3_LINAN|nr:uncharacterized protein LOC106166864 [Lingula anatina]|eukprot:XP_013400983.1 uncharacterized protein LOC106166864 [Lingula anatina]
MSFKVQTGVRQGCVLSSILFNLAIDWVMRCTTEDTSRGIRWTLYSTLEDLDFEDDLALLSHTHQHIQEKTDILNIFSQQIGLRISKKKTEVMALNIQSPPSVEVEGCILNNTSCFTYLGSIVATDGGTSRDVNNRLTKARNAFKSLNKIWKCSQYSIKTKLRIFESCILSTLLYGSECWRITEEDIKKLSTFHTSSLRKILKIFWPRTISNDDLLKQTNQRSISEIIRTRRWKWIGHVLRKDPNSTTKVAMYWTPEGHRKRGSTKTTWRRTVEAELKQLGESWGTIQHLARDREE